VKDKRPNNIERFVKKFEKDIEYANRHFGEFKKVFMLWSPIVRSTKERSSYNQMSHIGHIQKTLKEKVAIDLVIIINEDFMKCIEALRKIALSRTDKIKTPILRSLQIEEKLKVHISKLEKRMQRMS